MTLISMLCPRCLGDEFEHNHEFKCRETSMTDIPTQAPSELKPCPLCKGRADIASRTSRQDVGWSDGLGSPGSIVHYYHSIKCECCGVAIERHSLNSVTPAELIELWNRRTQAPTDSAVEPAGGTTGFMTNSGAIDVCDDPFHEKLKHEQRVIGHANGRQEYLNECVCGKPWPDCAQPERQERVLTQQERDGLHRAHQRSVVTVGQPPISPALREAAKDGAYLIRKQAADLREPFKAYQDRKAALLDAFAEGK